MSMILDGSNGVTFNDASLQGAAASPYVLKNRIINGDMRIDQRNAGASITPTDAQYSVDRWACYLSQTSKYTVQQNAGSVTPPAGFTNYLGVTSSSAYSITSTDYFAITQYIEGYNISDLGFGSASAKTITISFWVRSSLTGTFGGAIRNSAANRIYPFSYTISSANTWEQKTVTIAGDTTGTWLTTNGIGIAVWFGLGVGSTYSDTAGAWTTKASTSSATGAVSVVGTNGATFYITGVQLEQNTSATPFERRLYGQELANCQRYYETTNNAVRDYYGTGYFDSTTTVLSLWKWNVEKRATPSLAVSSTASGTTTVSYGAGLGQLNTSSSVTFNNISSRAALVGFTVAVPVTANQFGLMSARGDFGHFLSANAEL